MKPITNNLIRAALSLLIAIPMQSLQAADPAEAKTIGRIVRERTDLSTFQQLLEKTEIGSTVTEDTKRRYTVFAPVNKAFEKLPKGAAETLLNPRNDDRLEEVLRFHVLSGMQPPIGLEQLSLLRTATGQFVSTNYKDGKIGEAKFIAEVVPCSNGVLYLIDTVLTPTTDDLFQRLQKDGRFTIFTRAITASRQGKLFQNMHGLYTTFAPTDEAFKKLPPEYIESLFRPENNERLEDIIKHHITEGVFAAGKVPSYLSLGVSGVTPQSSFGQQLNFKVTDQGATIDASAVIETDLPCANGIVHVIDTVIPPVQDGLLDLLKEDGRFVKLLNLLQVTGLDLPVSSRTNYTVFAPTDEAFKSSAYAKLVADPTGENREAIYGLIARHVITGKHVSENCDPYNKLRTIHGAPIYLLRDGKGSTISGVPIVKTDIEGFNGLVNVIEGVIPDPMELPEGDISAIDAINFVQTTLDEGSKLYESGEYEDSWRYYIRRGQEYLTKYSEIEKGNLANAIRDDQPAYQYADDAWDARNAFRSVLRSLEQREDRLQDSYLMQSPDSKRFGR